MVRANVIAIPELFESCLNQSVRADLGALDMTPCSDTSTLLPQILVKKLYTMSTTTYVYYYTT